MVSILFSKDSKPQQELRKVYEEAFRLFKIAVVSKIIKLKTKNINPRKSDFNKYAVLTIHKKLKKEVKNG